MCTFIVTPWPEMFPNETMGNTPEVTPETYTLVQLGPSDTTEAPETDCDRLHEADETALAVSHFSDLHATTSVKFSNFVSLTRLYDRTASLA